MCFSAKLHISLTQRIKIVFSPYQSLVHSTPQITRTTPYLQYLIQKNTGIIFTTQWFPDQNFLRSSESSLTGAEQAPFHSPETKNPLMNYWDCELSLPPHSLPSHHLPLTNKNKLLHAPKITNLINFLESLTMKKSKLNNPSLGIWTARNVLSQIKFIFIVYSTTLVSI